MEYKNKSTLPVISTYKENMTDEDLKQLALQLRRDVIELTYYSGTKSSHVGGELSSADIMAVLYGAVRLAEAWGLWRAKAWASWLGLSAALYLPFDLYAFALHRHWLEAAAVVINLVVVWVLARDLFKRRR